MFSSLFIVSTSVSGLSHHESVRAGTARVWSPYHEGTVHSYFCLIPLWEHFPDAVKPLF